VRDLLLLMTSLVQENVRTPKAITIVEFITILDEYMHWYSEKRIKLSLGGMNLLQYQRYLGLIAA
jgi:putative transposase